MVVPYHVTLTDKAAKRLGKCPEAVRRRFEALAAVLRQSGPTGPHYWRNYSKLAENEYHCHLTYDHVACWRWERETIEVEVYYVGSREGAPY